MTCLGFGEVLEQWYADRWGILACFSSVLIIAHSMRLTRWLSTKFKPFLPRRRTEVDDRIAVLSLEVRKTKAELDALSPTAQFAAYFKKERHLTKLTTELNALTSGRKKDASIESTLYLAFVGVLVQLLALTLMLYSRRVVVGHISSAYFWPFNFFFYMPNLTAPVDESGNSEGTPVTLFAFLSLVMFVWRTSCPRNIGSMKYKSS